MRSSTNVSSAAAQACAKINLTLRVLGKRADGFHELESLVVGADLCDRVECTIDSEPGISLACNDPALAQPDNLVCRAAAHLAKRRGLDPALRIKLDKKIPVGAGLGGGSSDAAATLRICNQLWMTGLDDTELASLGADLGSDIPLFFGLPSVLMTGRGERVTPMLLCWSGWALLAFAGPLVPTASVYRAWRPSDVAPHSDDQVERLAEASSAQELSAMLINDLEAAVFRVSPTVAHVYDELNRLGIGPMRISGAGSALYRLFDERAEACEAASRIEAEDPRVETTVVAVPVGKHNMVSKEN